MYCANCGQSNVEGASFCKKCGSPMVKPGATVVVDAGRVPPLEAAPKQEGCVGAAWNDIRSTPGWLKKTLLLCLLGVVPVLNFAVEGYVLRWSRELSFGKRTCMPKEIFKKREVSTGFFAWIVRLALGGVFAVVSTMAIWFLAGLVGLVSAPAAAGFYVILAFACWVFEFFFYAPFTNVSILRMSVVDYLESGFNVGKSWKAFRKNMGSAVGASVLPPIAIGIVEGVVILLGILIVGAILAASAYGVYSGYSAHGSNAFLYGSNPQAVFASILGAGYGVMFLVSAFIIIVLMLNTFAMMLVARAMGHWVARTTPEWADESDAPVKAEGASLEESA